MMLRELTRPQWSAFHAAYHRGSTVTCAACQRTGEAGLRPWTAPCAFGCGWVLAVPEDADKLNPAEGPGRAGRPTPGPVRGSCCSAPGSRSARRPPSPWAWVRLAPVYLRVDGSRPSGGSARRPHADLAG